MFGVAMGLLGGRVIDRLQVVPRYPLLVFYSFLFQSIQLGAGGINIGAVAVTAFGIDVFIQMIQVSVSTAIYG